jgi:hypothetical protein
MKLMRVLDKTFKINKSMRPEMILTVAFPLEYAKDESEVISGEEFLKQFNEAMAEYERENENEVSFTD